MQQRDFAARLLDWFAGVARQMPWRGQSDPYLIWISEIMLQQTRVEAARDYYLRFVEALPNPRALAGASEQQLFKLWEGLGYYSRARNLQRAARIIVEHYDGKMPDTLEGLLSLPGVGEYTAGAVASIAYGIAAPAVDGNVLRVMTRFLADGGDITRPETRRRMSAEVMRLQPSDRPGDFNQALMELGALVCLPRRAKCGECPLADICRACELGRQADFPVKKAAAPRRVEQKTVLLILAEGKVALRRRPARGLLAGLWEFPTLDGHLTGAAALRAVREWGLEPSDIIPLPDSRHVFTHREWHMRGYAVRVYTGGPSLEWADLGRLQAGAALPSAFAKYRREAEKLLAAPPLPAGRQCEILAE